MLFLNVILDAAAAAATVADPTAGVWGALADKGLTIGILAAAVWILWKRDSAMAERLERYLAEDHARMADTIQKNTEAFTRLEEVLERMNARCFDLPPSRKISEEARGKD